MATRREYSAEFKREAVRLAEQRGNRSAVARELGIHLSMLRRWKQELHHNGQQAFPGKGNPHDEELARLRRELKRVEEENAILKKAVGIFSSRPR
jgi:transposase